MENQTTNPTANILLEGFLKKWTNYVYGWKTRYCCFTDDGFFHYAKNKSSKLKKLVPIQNCTIKSSPTEQLRIIITGPSNNTLDLRASTVEEKNKWIETFILYQAKEASQDLNIQLYTTRSRITSNSKKSFGMNLTPDEIGSNSFKYSTSFSFESDVPIKNSMALIKNSIGTLSILQGKLEEIVESLTLSITGETPKKFFHEMLTTMNSINKIITEIVNFVFDEGKKQNEMQLLIEKQLEKLDGIRINFDDGGAMKTEPVIQLPTIKVPLFDPSNKIKKSPQNIKTIEMMMNDSFDFDDKKYDAILNSIKIISELKYNLLTNNQVFQLFKITEAKKRDSLPRPVEPTKLDIWSIFKKKPGSSQIFSTPATFNEPLSFLQKMCEALQFSDLIERAAAESDSTLRLAYIAAFVVAGYSLTSKKLKKPCNPLLGETYEYENKEKGLKYVAEQVSHNPPISVCWASGPSFVCWSNSCIKTKLGATSLEFQALGSVHLKIEKTNDHFIFDRIPTQLNGLFFGTPYIDNVGELKITDLTTKDLCVLQFKKLEKKKECHVIGNIKNSLGKIMFEVEAKWNEYFKIKGEGENAFKCLWVKQELDPNAEKQFFFDKFALQLNYLNFDLLKKLPITDSRFRPDQRAIELGENEFANQEKVRLEERQRERLKKLSQTKYVPKYFNILNQNGIEDYEFSMEKWTNQIEREGVQKIFDEIFLQFNN